MSGETNLDKLLQGMSPKRHAGEYVFVSVEDASQIDRDIILCEFKEAEGNTLILEKNHADALQLSYSYVSAWITLEIHSSLDAVGLTARFAGELAKHHISCNVVAGYYHDHIFVDSKDGDKAINVLQQLSQQTA